MAVFDETYENLRNRIVAVVGANPTENEWLRLNALINRAAKRAFRSDMWERFIVVGEPRTVSRGLIASSEDSYNILGAETDAANGLFIRNGSNAGSKPAYTKYESNGETVVANLTFSEVTQEWYIQTADIDTLPTSTEIYYRNTSTSTTPPSTGWETVSGGIGSGTTPILFDLGDIDTAYYWQHHNPHKSASRTYEFQADTYGLRPYGLRDENTIVYVTYLKRFTDTYGDGTGGTTNIIPEEWFEYIALDAGYMFLSQERQSNPNGYAGIAYQEVRRALEDEQMRLDAQGLPETIRTNIGTRTSYSNIL